MAEYQLYNERLYRNRHFKRSAGLAQLPNDLLDHLKASAEYLNKVKQLILFGSYARGNAGKKSDIDLCLLYDGKKEEANEVAASYWVLINKDVSAKGFECDIVAFPEDMFSVGCSAGRLALIKNIKRDGVTLWTAN